jgi:hypothetical protein
MHIWINEKKGHILKKNIVLEIRQEKQ